MFHKTKGYCKARWQLLVIFFPEVLVATAAEQWLEARQSTRAFSRLGHAEWTIWHSFIAGIGGHWGALGGILVQPRNGPPFAVDAQQLAYWVEHKHLAMPPLPQDDILAYNKADTLTRVATSIQIAWFVISCIAPPARLASRVGVSPLEIATLGYIVCTLHFFFFWFRKPLDPNVRTEGLFDDGEIGDLCRSGQVAPGCLDTYTTTPLDFVKPLPDPKSLITPF